MEQFLRHRDLGHLEDDVLAAIQRSLAAATGRTVDLTSRVDPSIVGGMVARIGSTVFDGSIVSHLKRIRNYGANPEVHPMAIDIFYCIDGAATVVTGGKVVGGDNRMVGAKIEQGRADHMTKGDWLLVPSGTPHWHTEYPKPYGFYRYLLVKVQE